MLLSRVPLAQGLENSSSIPPLLLKQITNMAETLQWQILEISQTFLGNRTIVKISRPLRSAWPHTRHDGLNLFVTEF